MSSLDPNDLSTSPSSVATPYLSIINLTSSNHSLSTSFNHLHNEEEEKKKKGDTNNIIHPNQPHVRIISNHPIEKVDSAPLNKKESDDPSFVTSFTSTSTSTSTSTYSIQNVPTTITTSPSFQDMTNLIQQHGTSKSLPLESFLQVLPHAIRYVESHPNPNPTCASPCTDLIGSLYKCVNLTIPLPSSSTTTTTNLHSTPTLSSPPHQLSPYHIHMDPTKPYTRNLISTDNQTYTLLALCWNAKQYSPIHDHPSTNGCWMKVVQGCIEECRYSVDWDGDCLVESGTDLFHEGEQGYIHDSIGYHKVGNPTNEMAISIHLYSPPFDKCKYWSNVTDKFSEASVCYMVHHSK